MVLVVVTAIHLALTVQPDRWGCCPGGPPPCSPTLPPVRQGAGNRTILMAAGGQLPPTSPTPGEAAPSPLARAARHLATVVVDRSAVSGPLAWSV